MTDLITRLRNAETGSRELDAEVMGDSEGIYNCHAYWIDGGWLCPYAGTEECDWECDAPAQMFEDAADD